MSKFQGASRPKTHIRSNLKSIHVFCTRTRSISSLPQVPPHHVMTNLVGWCHLTFCPCIFTASKIDTESHNAIKSWGLLPCMRMVNALLIAIVSAWICNLPGISSYCEVSVIWRLTINTVTKVTWLLVSSVYRHSSPPGLQGENHHLLILAIHYILVTITNNRRAVMPLD